MTADYFNCTVSMTHHGAGDASQQKTVESAQSPCTDKYTAGLPALGFAIDLATRIAFNDDGLGSQTGSLECLRSTLGGPAKAGLFLFVCSFDHSICWFCCECLPLQCGHQLRHRRDKS